MIWARKIIKASRVAYTRTIGSIAFYPALIAIAFLFLAWAMLMLDFSETGKHIKSSYTWVRLKDASTARTIVSTIAGGIISLMVFSFSMVMILLNQAASQMSNRMLEGMISNRFQQYVLGLYIGTIVYSLFLLSTIRDIESGIYVPALSIYLLLIVTVADIFIFIYFLHYVTQSVKFETIIERVHRQTVDSLKLKLKVATVEPAAFSTPNTNLQLIRMQSSGFFQGFDKHELLRLTSEHDFIIKFLHPEGAFLLENEPLLEVFREAPIDDEITSDLMIALDFYIGQPIGHNYYYGFHQLTEVALKALSPGINDPQTAVLSLNALADLFHHRLTRHEHPLLFDNDDRLRIILRGRSFKELFTECILPIWDYGKNDKFVQDATHQRVMQLKRTNVDKEVDVLLTNFLNKVGHSIQKRGEV